MDSSIPVRLRKYEYDLQAAGQGIFLFGAWGALRIILLYILDVSRDEEFSEALGLSENTMQRMGLIVIVFIIAGLVFALHAYIGICASSEGLRRKKRRLYLVLAVIIAVVKFYNIISDAQMMTGLDMGTAQTAVTLIVNMTAFIACMALVINAVQVKRLRKVIRLAKEERLAKEKQEKEEA